MKRSPSRYFYHGLMLAALSFVLDQGSKWLLLNRITSEDRPMMELLPFFNLVRVWNYGISFGMLAQHRQPLLLTALSVVIVVILLVWLHRNTSRLVACALGFVIGGAVGNMVDRLRFDAVADFLDFHIGNYHWPAFNVADSSIFIGVVLLCVSSMFMERHHQP